MPLLLASLMLVQAPAPLTDAHQRDLRCAAAFAIVAAEQQRGVTSALAYPPLSERGKRYFADVALRVGEETGLDSGAVRDLLVGAAAALQDEARQAADPVAVLDAAMTPCLAELDRSVPAPPPPDALHCAVYLRLAYDEVHAREGLSPAAQDLLTLATVLESRARDGLRAEGLSTNETDARFAATREAILAEDAARQQAGDPVPVDFQACFDLAAPDRSQEGHAP